MADKAGGLQVLKPGVLTLLQDLGRFGYQHLGLTTGGAADEHAFLWANRLLGNHPGSAALEVCYGGLELEAHTATRIAITGADIAFSINGVAGRTWQTYNIAPGDQIRFGYARSGIRAYLAVGGGFDIAPTFGSAATVMREGVGGLDRCGNSLRSGDWLPCSKQAPTPITAVPPRFIPDYSQPLTLRTIVSHRQGMFDEHALRTFYSCTYELSHQSDRMGARLLGEPLTPVVTGIISEGVSFGAVQVPADGQPIILMKDRQTIGGYPTIGSVFALDAFALAQRQGQSRVCFQPFPLHEAQRLLRRFYHFFGV